MTDLSIVIPVYNNESTLQRLTDVIHDHLQHSTYSFEILFVNDGSSDQSNKLLNRIALEKSFVRHIALEKNQGQHKAILHGFNHATGMYIVVMDADLQDDPAMIRTMCTAIDSERQAVFVLRQGAYQSFGRMITSRGLKLLIQFITGLHHKAGTYFVFHRTLLNDLFTLKCRYPYVTIMVACCAEKIRYVKSKRGNSQGSSYTFRKRCQVAYRALVCSVDCTINRPRGR